MGKEVEVERSAGRCLATLEAAWAAYVNQSDYQRAAVSIWPDLVPPNLSACLSDLARAAHTRAWHAFARLSGLERVHKKNIPALADLLARGLDIMRQFHDAINPWTEFDPDRLRAAAWRHCMI